jgi:hypothetical protein
MDRTIVIGLLGALLPSLAVAAEPAELQKAHQFWQTGKYAQALEAYDALAQRLDADDAEGRAQVAWAGPIAWPAPGSRTGRSRRCGPWPTGRSRTRTSWRAWPTWSWAAASGGAPRTWPVGRWRRRPITCRRAG